MKPSIGDFNISFHPPYPMWMYVHEEMDLEEESNQRLKNIFGTTPLIESKNENYVVQE